MGFFRSAPTATEELEAIRLRVHPGTVWATCGWCGLLTDCPTDRGFTTEALDGRPLTWAVCGRCSQALAANDLHRRTIADILEIDPGALRQLAVRVTRFADVPGARPDKPNPYPWGHLDERALALEVEQARQALREVTAPQPCGWCGTTRCWEDHAYGQGPQGIHCPACEWHLVDRRFQFEDGPRDYAAHWLLGADDQGVPRGLGVQLPVRYFRELEPAEQAALPSWRESWVWLDRATLIRWARQHGLPTGRIGRRAW